MFGWLADAHLIAGRIEDGLDAITQAFTDLEETGERHWEAELHRIKGELLLLREGNESEAEKCFNDSLEIAKAQSAEFWELRTSMSVARLW